jgi:hypothetical protein
LTPGDQAADPGQVEQQAERVGGRRRRLQGKQFFFDKSSPGCKVCRKKPVAYFSYIFFPRKINFPQNFPITYFTLNIPCFPSEKGLLLRKTYFRKIRIGLVFCRKNRFSITLKTINYLKNNIH